MFSYEYQSSVQYDLGVAENHPQKVHILKACPQYGITKVVEPLGDWI